MTGALDFLLAQGTPLAPPLQTRLIALIVVEVFLLTTAVLLYLLWAQLKKQPLDEWWATRKAVGFSPRMRGLMEASEEERLAAEGPQASAPATEEPGSLAAAAEAAQPAADAAQPAADAAGEPRPRPGQPAEPEPSPAADAETATEPEASSTPDADTPTAEPAAPEPHADTAAQPATKRPPDKLPPEPPTRPLAGPPRPPAEPPTR